MHQLDEKTLVGGQIAPAQVAELKQQGVTMIVNNRPDDEEPGQPLGADIKAAAEAVGIEYRHLPIMRGIGPADADAMLKAIDACDGKLLAFCKSGTSARGDRKSRGRRRLRPNPGGAPALGKAFLG
jgi:uncharacterized protein (TIGR01244 family)